MLYKFVKPGREDQDRYPNDRVEWDGYSDRIIRLEFGVVIKTPANNREYFEWMKSGALVLVHEDTMGEW